MSCAACVASVEKAVKALFGVKNANANLLTNSLSVCFDDELLNDNEIINAVKRAGYFAKPYGKDNRESFSDKEECKRMQKRFWISFAILIPLWYISMGQMIGLPLISLFNKLPLLSALFQFVLCVAVVIINKKYFTSGIPKLFRGEPNMDSLISIGVIASLIFSSYSVVKIGQGYDSSLYFDSAAMILTLVTLGKWLEKRSSEKTGKAIRDLVSLTPKTATVVRDGNEIKVDSNDILVNDTVVVLPGGVIPCDGKALCSASIDESAMTGESQSVEIEKGMPVRAGTINLVSKLEFEASAVSKDTMLSKMIELIEKSIQEKVPSQRLADKISRYFVPIIIAIAATVGVIWFFLTQSIETSLVRAISVLVIACPCSLGLATPVAIIASTGKAASVGIVFRNATALETLGNVKGVLFDKTGTLTKGQSEVVDVVSDDVRFTLGVASCLEHSSSHPIADAICKYSKNLGYDNLDAHDVKTLPGYGICGIVDSKTAYCCSFKYAKENFSPNDETQMRVDNLSKQGKTIVIVTFDNTIIGIIALSDTPRESAKGTIAKLQENDISTCLISGDSLYSANHISEELGIKEYYHSVLPDKKSEIVSEIQSKIGKCAMVGDGINDAVALSSAEVGIAMGSGTDIAAESSDIVLIKNDLYSICDAIELSKICSKIIKQNLFWALIYNCIGVTFAAGVFGAFNLYATPELASLAMSLSSFFVVSNALRLQNVKLPSQTNKNNIKKIERNGVMTEKTMIIEGMMCMHCASRVKSAIEAINGLTAEIDIDAGKAIVKGVKIDENKIKTAIENAGYQVKSIQ